MKIRIYDIFEGYIYQKNIMIFLYHIHKDFRKLLFHSLGEEPGAINGPDILSTVDSPQMWENPEISELEELQKLAETTWEAWDRMWATLEREEKRSEVIGDAAEYSPEIQAEMREKAFSRHAEEIWIDPETLARLYEFNSEYNGEFDPETFDGDMADFATQMWSIQSFLEENNIDMPENPEEFATLMENFERDADGRIHIPMSREEAEELWYEFRENADGTTTIVWPEYVHNGENEIPAWTSYVAWNSVMQGRPRSATVPWADADWSGNSAGAYSPDGAAPHDENPGERLGELLVREETIWSQRVAQLVESGSLDETQMQEIETAMQWNPRCYPVLMGDNSVCLMTNPTYAPDVNGDGVSSNEAIAYAQANNLLLPTRNQTDAARNQAQVRGIMPARNNQGVSFETQVTNTRTHRAMLEDAIASHGDVHVWGMTKIWAFEPGQEPGLNGAYSNMESGETYQWYSTVHGPDYADYSQAAQFVHPLRINADGSIEWGSNQALA